MSVQLHAWRHVHVVMTDWHDAAKWHAEHTPAESIPWDHDKHRGYKAEIGEKRELQANDLLFPWLVQSSFRIEKGDS